MSGYDLSGNAETVATSATTALRAAMTSAKFQPIGVNAMLGLAHGILSGRASVVSAIQSVATAAVQAAKNRLKVESPSKVFADEVGAMIPKGMAVGALKESKAQAKVIANAARYLRSSMEDGFAAGVAYDNRKSYTISNSATVNVEKLVVQDKNDVRALAQEIGVVQRRAAMGMGG